MTKPLDAVFFDIDDTLFSTTVFADKARRNAVDAMIRAGLRVDRADAMRELEEVIAEFSSNYGSHFDKVLDRLGADAYQGHNRAVIVESVKEGFTSGFRHVGTSCKLINTLQAAGVIILEGVGSYENLADGGTKPIGRRQFNHHATRMGVLHGHA